MMKKILKLQLLLVIFCFQTLVWAESGKAYLDRFMQYYQWYQQLPLSPSPEFIAFVDNHSPLSNKLRDKWLYELARTKDWSTYSKHYQYTDDPSLQCYEQRALYELGQHQEAIEGIKKLWLVGYSQPNACNELFSQLLKSKDIDNQLITQRINLALEQRNISLASYLLKQFSPPRIDEAQLLKVIYQDPRQISKLTPSELHGEFYLYGLKRMVAMKKMDQALQLWELAQSKGLLNKRQQQAFIAHVALYKAMRNQEDAQKWFNKIDPIFYNDVLLGWQIRLALKNKDWPQVEKLINQAPDKDNPGWQYWLARALEAQGEKEKANIIYQNIAKIRNYYGFLASLRLKKKFSFENERAVENTKMLQPYQPILEQVKNLYSSKQTLQASRLLNDFASELPKDDKSALVYWVDHDLKWHSKAVYLSNNKELNNQLSLRFPLAYKQTVKTYARNFNIAPELIYAIIRQESSFSDNVTSSAGAQGLMQIMPATASSISKYAKIPYADKKQLFLPEKNIHIGAAYIKDLGKRFAKHPILIIAAYNAGPRQVNYWLKNHPPKDMDIWIETLPWQETRNYLKNVIAFYAVYQYRLQGKPDLTPFMTNFMP